MALLDTVKGFHNICVPFIPALHVSVPFLEAFTRYLSMIPEDEMFLGFTLLH